MIGLFGGKSTCGGILISPRLQVSLCYNSVRNIRRLDFFRHTSLPSLNQRFHKTNIGDGSQNELDARHRMIGIKQIEKEKHP